VKEQQEEQGGGASCAPGALSFSPSEVRTLTLPLSVLLSCPCDACAQLLSLCGVEDLALPGPALASTPLKRSAGSREEARCRHCSR